MAGTLLKAVEGHGGWTFISETCMVETVDVKTLRLAASIMQRFLRL